MPKFYDSPFHAVKDSPKEASNMALRADLIIFIRNIVEQYGWSQKEVAKALEIAQPRVSDLLTGKVEKFGLDKLIMFIVALGYQPTFSDSKDDHSIATIRFEEKVA